MRINSKGQVTIPARMRKMAGLLPNTEVQVFLEGQSIRITRIQTPKRPRRAERAVRRLWGSATVHMSTDEIIKLMRGK